MYTYKETDNFFKLLADEVRIEILHQIVSYETCNCNLSAYFDISQPAISRHMKKLRDEGMIIERKDARWVYYSLNKAYKYYDLLVQILSNFGTPQPIEEQMVGCGNNAKRK